MTSEAIDPNLCATCEHARRVESDRGSTFLMCDRSRTDPRYVKYPRLPVLRCEGYEQRCTLDDPVTP